MHIYVCGAEVDLLDVSANCRSGARFLYVYLNITYIHIFVYIYMYCIILHLSCGVWARWELAAPCFRAVVSLAA